MGGSTTNAVCCDYKAPFPPCEGGNSVIAESIDTVTGDITYTHNDGDGGPDRSWTISATQFNGVYNGLNLSGTGEVGLGGTLSIPTTINQAGNDLNINGGDLNIGTANSDSTDTYFRGIDANTAKEDCSTSGPVAIRYSDSKLVPYSGVKVLSNEYMINPVINIPLTTDGINNFFNEIIDYSWTNTTGCDVEITWYYSAVIQMQYKNSDTFDGTQPYGKYQVASDGQIFGILGGNNYQHGWDNQQIINSGDEGLVVSSGHAGHTNIVAPGATVSIRDRIISTIPIGTNPADFRLQVKFSRYEVTIKTLN